MKIRLKYYIGLALLLCSINTYSQSWTTVGSGTDNYVSAIEQYNNKLFVGGNFLHAGGVPTNKIASWDGIVWDSISSGIGGSGRVSSLFNFSSFLYVGGDFNNVGNLTSSSGGGIASWNDMNWSWVGGGVVTFSPYVPGYVYALSSYNNELFIGGRFLTAGGSTIPNIAKWDGANWSSLTIATFDPYIYSMIVYNNELYVGGSFSNTGTISATNLAKWNGSSWSTVGTGTNNSVNCFAIYNGELYVGGNFTIVADAISIAANYIAKWNGTNWSTVGTGMDARVSALAVYNGELYAGGNFTSAGGVSANHIAKWNGTSWSPLGSGINGGVGAMKEFNGDLYVGGSFTTAGGFSANNIAKWNNPIGLKEINIANEISIYPNPASGKIYINKSEAIKEINELVLIDACGIQHNITRNNKSEIDVSILSDGFYFLQIKTSEGVITKKVVVQH